MVAGGGNVGGGGGAGGYRTNVSGSPGDHTTSVAFPVAVQSCPVTVGGGGVAGKNTESAPDGNDSSFGPITSLKGGGGGSRTGGSNPVNGWKRLVDLVVVLVVEKVGSATGGSSTAVSTPSWLGPATQGKAGGAGANDPHQELLVEAVVVLVELALLVRQVHQDTVVMVVMDFQMLLHMDRQMQ